MNFNCILANQWDMITFDNEVIMRKFECLNCTKTFFSDKFCKNRNPKFCSKYCFQNRQISNETRKKLSDAKKGRSPWNKGFHMWEGKQHPKGTLGKPSKRKGIKASPETIKKLKESHYGIKYPQRCGENHWFWKGGVTSENVKIRKSSDYANWRRKVFERDDFTCQICQQRGGKLHADHIMPFSTHPELRLELSNGRSLCIDCHKKTDSYGIRGILKRNEEIISHEDFLK